MAKTKRGDHYKKGCKFMNGQMSPPYSVCTCGRVNLLPRIKAKDYVTVEKERVS